MSSDSLRVLSYAQFGAGSEAAYLGYLRVVVLDYLKDVSVSQGRDVAAVVDQVIGSELGCRVMCGVGETASGDGRVGKHVRGIVCCDDTGVCRAAAAGDGRREGVWSCRRTPALLVSGSDSCDDGRVGSDGLGVCSGGSVGGFPEKVGSCLGEGGGVDCESGGVVQSAPVADAPKVLVESAAVGSSEFVAGKQHKKNVRKRERARAKRVVSVGKVGEQGGVASKAGVEVEVVGVEFGSGVVVPDGSSAFVRSDLECVVSVGERKQLAREWYERKRAENALATQRARYNYKRNEYLDRARISEKRWEQERLSCEQKLAKITEARFGSKPGYAETLASVSDGSEVPPSLSTDGNSPANLSDGTISPGSSMSVAEENRLKKKVEDLAGEVAQLKLERVALNAACKFSGGKAVVEGGRVHVYDGSGQYVPPTPVYGSECELYSMGDYPEELQYS